MSLPEVTALFQRGRAEVNGRGATTSPAFAAAILQRGVDAGQERREVGNRNGVVGDISRNNIGSQLDEIDRVLMRCRIAIFHGRLSRVSDS